ncbi:hypothetical protein ACPOL_5088 [Acidisarcina polymorpha]|uniref:Uncharacterized protein n=1 Tax=Acidisarcina polymorpha TaxID=2211140 RepID=A0A2Z5G6P5_9BACT|nr:hypothetical protein ACPOL_5088 [Acidisarcina polymorpha]
MLVSCLLAQAQDTHDRVGEAPAPSVSSAQPTAVKSPDATTPAPAPAPDPRQAQLIADSQKLLKLSQELKLEVDKSNKDTLSLAVIKKAEEVEKLAKTLKAEMNKAH